MKIYTKKGDQGTTSLIGGSRVPKHHIRIEAYGTVDELNSHLGLLSTMAGAEEFRPLIKAIQDNLFTIGSLLALEEDAHMKLAPLPVKEIEALEQSIDSQELLLQPLRNFVLPGGHPSNAQAHIARCVCRRAERAVVHLSEHHPVPEEVLSYLNRLSDWLFVFARTLSRLAGAAEVVWAPRSAE